MQLRRAWKYQEDVSENLSESPVVDQENRVGCILEVNNNVRILSELGPGEPHKEITLPTTKLPHEPTDTSAGFPLTAD